MNEARSRHVSAVALVSRARNLPLFSFPFDERPWASWHGPPINGYRPALRTTDLHCPPSTRPDKPGWPESRFPRGRPAHSSATRVGLCHLPPRRPPPGANRLSLVSRAGAPTPRTPRSGTPPSCSWSWRSSPSVCRPPPPTRNPATALARIHRYRFPSQRRTERPAKSVPPRRCTGCELPAASRQSHAAARRRHWRHQRLRRPTASSLLGRLRRGGPKPRGL
mmetsp:Transcript_69800/g.195120  ORF Transcript_69800/g.195120 Transcript_69800/m.195120 type:complete len:222 (+) Transcript_69800:70-735(+)